jgi:hypothetical protein
MALPACLSFEDAVRDDGAALRATIRQHGYAHVTGVVPVAQCAEWAKDLRYFVSHLGFPGRVEDAASVADPDAWPNDCRQGVFGTYGVGA